METKKLTEEERTEAVKLLNEYRKLSEVQKAGFQLMVEGAKLMNEGNKDGNKKTAQMSR